MRLFMSLRTVSRRLSGCVLSMWRLLCRSSAQGILQKADTCNMNRMAAKLLITLAIALIHGQAHAASQGNYTVDQYGRLSDPALAPERDDGNRVSYMGETCYRRDRGAIIAITFERDIDSVAELAECYNRGPVASASIRRRRQVKRGRVKCAYIRSNGKASCRKRMSATTSVKFTAWLTNQSVARIIVDAMDDAPIYRCGFFKGVPGESRKIVYLAFSMDVCKSDAMAARISRRVESPCTPSPSSIFSICTDENGDIAITQPTMSGYGSDPEWKYTLPDGYEVVWGHNYRYTLKPWARDELGEMGLGQHVPESWLLANV